MPKLLECLEEAGVLVAVMIPSVFLPPLLFLFVIVGGGLGCVCCPVLVFLHSVLLTLTTVTMPLASF